jgi:hypothetical protein
MAAFDFPTSPTVGQAYGNYLWDGEKWTLPNLVDAVAARKSIYAAPFDAMAYSGMQINGSMDVSQESNDTILFSGAQTKYLPIDGWLGQVALTTGSVHMYRQVLSTEVPGFKQCLQMATSVAQATLTGSDYVRFITRIEGYRFQRMAWGTANARPLTVGFWARASAAGTYRALLQNFDGSTNSPAWVPFTLAGGANFQWVTLAFPAMTTGVWKADNTIGVHILIEMASDATPNIITSGGYFSITGVVALPGIEAPSAERSPLIMRPYAEELLTCQRYYAETVGSHRYPQVTAAPGFGESGVFWPVTMRAIPTITFGSNSGTNNLQVGYPIIHGPTIQGGRFAIAAINNSAMLDTYCLNQIIKLDARL